MKSTLRLLVLTGVTLVPVTWALVTAFEGTLRVQRETALSALQETARTLAAAVDSEHRAATSMLRALATSPSLAKGDMAAFRRQAVDSLAGANASIIVFDSYGQQVFNTSHPVGAVLPAERGRSVLDVIRSRAPVIFGSDAASDANALAFFTIAVPAPAGGGKTHVLAARFSPDVLRRITSELKVAPGVITGSFDDRGRMLAGNRWASEAARSERFIDLIEAARKAREGTFVFRSEAGVRLHCAFARTTQSEWIVAAMIPVDTLDTPTKQVIRLAALGIVTSLLLGFFLAPLLRLITMINARRERGVVNQLPAIAAGEAGATRPGEARSRAEALGHESSERPRGGGHASLDAGDADGQSQG